jgi:hypothetical protein
MRPWPPSQNPFTIATDGTYTIAMDISTFHDTALSASKSDPFFLGLYNTYHPLHISYKTIYDAWASQGDSQQQETLSVVQLLNLLSTTKIRQWDVKIQEQYDVKTPEYKGLLPNHRIPFQQGKRPDRIQAVKRLSTAIGTDEKLATLKTEVDAYYTMLDTASNDQQESKSTTKGLSGQVEAARLTMCKGQFVDLGALIQKFPDQPEKINGFYALHLIRSSPQIIFTKTLKPTEVYTVVKHTFGEEDQIVLFNKGNTDLKFYLAGEKNMQPGEKFVTMGPGTQTVLASTLGNLSNKYLTVLNTSALMNGQFELELI